VEALEEERYDLFAARVYAQGFLKKFLGALGVKDQDEIVGQFQAEWYARRGGREAEIPPPLARDLSFFSVTPKRLVTAVGVLFLLPFLSLVGWQLGRFTGAPQLILEDPEEGEAVEEPYLALRGRIEKESRLTVNGREITIDHTGNFNETIELPAGATTLEFLAENRFGKTTTIVRNVVVK